jgi:hypothetical protein
MKSITVKDWEWNKVPKNYTGHIIFSGGQYWYKKGKFHREDGPAAINNTGNLSWYNNGELHREDGPAVINNNGNLYWYNNGELVQSAIINRH